jgi:hypothetical protein
MQRSGICVVVRRYQDTNGITFRGIEPASDESEPVMDGSQPADSGRNILIVILAGLEGMHKPSQHPES